MSVLNSILNLLRFNSKNWKAVVLCVFAATVFWFFNSLNKSYSTNISFPVNFDYDEENFMPVKPLPSSVRINVTGIGWDLFRRSLGLKIPPLVIPLERPAETKKIVAAPALFAHQMERLRINFVLSDTFHVAIEPKSKRWITVRLEPSSIYFREGYRRTSETIIEPDSIFIEGPTPLVNSFIEPVYLKLSERKLDSDYHEDVEVEFLHNELIQRKPPTVEVRFSVDKLVLIQDSVKLKLVNHPKGTRPYFGMNALGIKVNIPEKNLQTFNIDSVTAVIDLKYFKRGSAKIKPELVGLPPYSEIVMVDSVFVKLY
jgi:hypothetical protein